MLTLKIEVLDLNGTVFQAQLSLPVESFHAPESANKVDGLHGVAMALGKELGE